MATTSRIPNKARTMDIWEPLIGRPAATALYRTKWVIGTAKWAALADVLVIFVVLHLARSWSVAVAWIAGTALVLFCSMAAIFFWQYHAEASRALGVQITSKNAPPSDRSKYLEWCRRNGVRPLNSSTDA